MPTNPPDPAEDRYKNEGRCPGCGEYVPSVPECIKTHTDPAEEIAREFDGRHGNTAGGWWREALGDRIRALVREADREATERACRAVCAECVSSAPTRYDDEEYYHWIDDDTERACGASAIRRAEEEK